MARSKTVQQGYIVGVNRDGDAVRLNVLKTGREFRLVGDGRNYLCHRWTSSLHKVRSEAILAFSLCDVRLELTGCKPH